MLGAHLVYFLAWLSFALGHSALAADPVKARLRPALGAAYRLAYNGFALAHFAGVVAVGRIALADAPGLARPDGLEIAQPAMLVAGLAVLAWALTGYDLGRLGGLAQIRAARRGRGNASPPFAEDEPLRLAGLHRYVRHPLYSGLFLVLWGLADSELGLATAIWGSLYLAVGTRFEERKLMRHYGEAYARYRDRVPAFLPWRGRAA
ncbi:MAG: methyltransferase family protein [Pseudomonadota bacterium]